MLGQVADKLDSWLGRSFVLSCYVPCLVFAFLNAGIASVDRPEILQALIFEYQGFASTKAFDLLALLLIVAIVAFALSPFVRIATLLLQGDSMPSFVAEPLLVFEAQKRERLAARGAAIERRRLPLPTKEIACSLLRDARAVGATLKRVTDRAKIERANSLVQELCLNRLLNRPIDASLFNEVLDAAATALRLNCAETGQLAVPVSAQDAEAAALLNDLHESMRTTLIPYVIDVAERADADAFKKLFRRFGESGLMPTRLGNEAAELRSYCATRYGLDFDFFWPRLLLVIQDDEKLSAAIVRAKIQVDFYIVSLLLTIFTGVFWLIAIIVQGRNPWTLWIIAFAFPLLLAGWFELLHASYTDFSEVVRSAIDLTRRRLLTRLCVAAPDTSTAERDTWEALGRWLVLNEADADMPFDMSASHGKI